jgi:hypothetical protein
MCQGVYWTVGDTIRIRCSQCLNYVHQYNQIKCYSGTQYSQEQWINVKYAKCCGRSQHEGRAPDKVEERKVLCQNRQNAALREFELFAL